MFCYGDGDSLRPHLISRDVDPDAAADAGLPIRLRDRRHTVCSLTRSGGVPIEKVQMILGHASPGASLRVYARRMRTATAEQCQAR